MPINLWGIGRPRITGIDLGGSSVKVIQISGKKIPLAAICNITPAEKAERNVLTERLRKFFGEAGIAGCNAVVAVPGEQAFVRTINFPAMPEAELKEALKWEIRRQIPYTEDEAVTDYIAKESPEGLTVTFAAAEKKNVKRFVSVFEDAGMKVTAVDITPLALMRAISQQGFENCVMVDIGSAVMEIIIVKSGMLRLARTVEMGSDLIFNALISSGMNPEDALKTIHSSMTDEMKAPVNQLLREVSRSIDYYKANFKEPAGDMLLLSGGISMNQNILSYVAATMHTKVTVPDPFAEFSLKDEGIRSMGPRFSLAMGLARRT